MVLKNSYRVLLMGDRDGFADAVAAELSSSGFACASAATVTDGVRQLVTNAPDIVVLTLAPAHRDGSTACRAIRAESEVPIVAVSGRDTEDACVELLGAGADDFVASPYRARELQARIHSAIRRSNTEAYRAGAPGRTRSEGVLEVGNVRLDLTTCRVSVNGVVKTLTPNEFRLMAVFLRSPGHVFTREDLRRRVWPDDQHSLHLVEVHIANLRMKIEADPHHPTYLVTVRSRGYKFAV